MSGRWGVVTVAVLVPAVVLAVDPAGWYWFGPAKWLVLTALLPLAAAATWQRGSLRIVRAPTASATALLAWLCLAASTGLDRRYAWLGTPERHLGVVTWALCVLALLTGQSLLPRGRELTWLAGGLAAAALGLGAIATAEAIGWEPQVLDVGRRLTGSLGSSAYLGAAAALLLPIAVGIAADRAPARAVRATAAVATPFVGVALLGSGARAAWVGVAAAAVALAAARRDALRHHPRRVAGALAAMAIGVALLALVTPVGPRVAATFDRDEPGGRGRIDEWRVASRVLADHPVFGVGPEGYRIAFSDGVDDAYERDHGRDPLPDRAHAAPLDVALAGGVPALALWLAFLAFAGRHVWRSLRSDHPWLVGLACGLVAYQAGEMLLFPIGELEPVVWVLAGVAIAATARPSEYVERTVPAFVTPAVGALAVVAIAAGSLDVAADRSARQALDAMARGDGARAYEAADHAASLRPDEVRLHLLVARAAIADERGTVAALASVDRALHWSPADPVARIERASLLVDRARATLVPDHIEAAGREVSAQLERDPHRAELWLLAGHVERLRGDGVAATRDWQRAESLAPRDPAPPAALALLYLEQGRRDEAEAAAQRALAVDPADAAALEVQRRLGTDG